MPAKKSVSFDPQAGTAEVDAFMATLEHPQKAEIARLRALILQSDPNFQEGIKWKVPSFRHEQLGADDYCVTFHLRSKDGIMLVLHAGSKKRATDAGRLAVPDPTGLLTWLGSERATVTFADMAQVEARAQALQTLLRAWVQALG